MWILRCYRAGRGGGFEDWYDLQAPEIQAEIDATLDILVWQRDLSENSTYEDLRGKCRGLGEIRVDVADGKFRILGFKGPGRREFTLLVGFRKKTNADYGVECPKALRRKEGVKKDGKRAPVCAFP